MTAAATVRRGLLVDLSCAQRAEPDAVSQWVGRLCAALLEIPGAVRGLLLDPSLPLPGSLHPALLRSPLLRWNTAGELRRAAADGPVAYLMPLPPGTAPGATLLPAPVAERDIPLVIGLNEGLVWRARAGLRDEPKLSGGDDGGRSATAALAWVGLDICRHADLLLTSLPSAREQAVDAFGIDPSRVAVVPLHGEDNAAAHDLAAAIVAAVGRLDAPAPPSDRWPLRLALVGAMPPSHAPSAALSSRLVEALAPRCRLDVASDDRADASWIERAGVRRLHASVDSIARSGQQWSYDAVVHVVGASPADLPALRSARRVPGILWLHDTPLAEPHRIEAAATDAPAAELARRLRRVYADRAPAPLLSALEAGHAAAFDAAAERRYGLLLTADVVREARAVVVESEAAARRVRLDQGASAPCPPITVIDPGDAAAAASQLLALVASLVRGTRRADVA